MAMRLVLEFPVRNLKLEALARFGQENWDIGSDAGECGRKKQCCAKLQSTPL
jgi:hypothetical protein